MTTMVLSAPLMTGHAECVTDYLLSNGPSALGYTQTMNDWFDREIDAINEPYRPIPSGTAGYFPHSSHVNGDISELQERYQRRMSSYRFGYCSWADGSSPMDWMSGHNMIFRVSCPSLSSVH